MRTTVTLDPDTGDYSVTQNAAIEHAAGNDENNQEFTLAYRVTDGDGDIADGSLAINVDDDTPIVNAVSHLVFANELSTTGATGTYDYSIGADSRSTYSALNSDFSMINLAGLVGAVAISDTSVVWAAEDDNSASFDFSFKYAANPLTPSVLDDASGTLVFDKDAGTYTVTLDDPIDSFTVLTTSSTVSSESYNIDGSAASQPEIVVSKLADDFFVRFTAFEETGGSIPVDLQTSNGDTAFVNGETFTADQAWVSISGTENGVASDTLQSGEVLNMDFYTASPGGDVSPGDGTARADGMYLKLAKLGAGEDLVILLKLIDPDDDSTTTRAIVVDYGDVYLSSEANPYGITFEDGSDGVVIIEGNDYNGAGENYLIYGAQLLVSTEGVTGSGIDLNRDTGDTGASTTTDAFGPDTVDTDVIKVVDIGIISSTTNTVDAHLTFDFQNVDGDADMTGTQTLDVLIEGNHMFVGTAADDVILGSSDSDVIQGGAGDDVMTGGDGIDAFLYDDVDLDAGHDVITDFQYGAGGDQLDLSELFAGADVDDLVAAGNLSISGDSSTLNVVIDQDGVAGGSDNVMITVHLDGGTLDPAPDDNVIDTMLNNNIKTEIP